MSTHLLVQQKASFNSPVWFNVGIEKHPQSSARFINVVQDTMSSTAFCHGWMRSKPRVASLDAFSPSPAPRAWPSSLVPARGRTSRRRRHRLRPLRPVADDVDLLDGM